MKHTAEMVNKFKQAHDAWSNKMLGVADHNLSFEIAEKMCNEFETVEALEAEIARYYN